MYEKLFIVESKADINLPLDSGIKNIEKGKEFIVLSTEEIYGKKYINISERDSHATSRIELKHFKKRKDKQYEIDILVNILKSLSDSELINLSRKSKKCSLSILLSCINTIPLPLVNMEYRRRKKIEALKKSIKKDFSQGKDYNLKDIMNAFKVLDVEDNEILTFLKSL